MKALKPAAALALTGIGSALVIGFQVPEASPVAATTATTTAGSATTGTSSAATGTATTTADPSSTPSPTTAGDASGTTVAAAATYADGTWTGTAVEEPWGTFQVQAVVSGGRLVDVVVVTAPTDHHSSRINDEAVPVLTEAAIAAQGAEVDLISGATWTSQSYATSLQGALDAAAAAAETAA